MFSFPGITDGWVVIQLWTVCSILADISASVLSCTLRGRGGSIYMGSDGRAACISLIVIGTDQQGAEESYPEQCRAYPGVLCALTMRQTFWRICWCLLSEMREVWKKKTELWVCFCNNRTGRSLWPRSPKGSVISFNGICSLIYETCFHMMHVYSHPLPPLLLMAWNESWTALLQSKLLHLWKYGQWLLELCFPILRGRTFCSFHSLKRTAIDENKWGRGGERLL